MVVKGLKEHKLVHEGPVKTKRSARAFFGRFKKAVRENVVMPVVLTAVMFTAVALTPSKSRAQIADNKKTLEYINTSQNEKSVGKTVEYPITKENGNGEKLTGGPNNEPMMMIFNTGYRSFSMGAHVGVIDESDLKKLGVTAFDGNEKDFIVRTETQGNIHFILNKNWTGVLVFMEKGMTEDGTKTYIPITIFPTTDGSKVIPSTIRTNGSISVVATDQGLILFSNDKQGYMNIAKKIGVEKLENVTIEIIDGLIEIKTSNYPDKLSIACK